jgi:chemotaxis protein CheC
MTLTPAQLDILKEMVNIGVGHAANVLNAMLGSHIELNLPLVEILDVEGFRSKVQQLSQRACASVRIGFKGPFTGSASLIFPAPSAGKLVSLLTEGEGEAADLDSLRVGTLTEVGNIVLNGVMGAIGNEIHQHLFYSVPMFVHDPLDLLFKDTAPDEIESVIWIQTRFTSQAQQIEGEIVLLFGAGSMELLIRAVNGALQVWP